MHGIAGARARVAASGPVAVPSGRQFATEYAEVDPATIKEQYDSAPPNMQLALDVVRQSAPDRLTYEELELSSGGRAVGSVQSSVGGALGMGPSTHVHTASAQRTDRLAATGRFGRTTPRPARW